MAGLNPVRLLKALALAKTASAENNGMNHRAQQSFFCWFFFFFFILGFSLDSFFFTVINFTIVVFLRGFITLL